MSHLCCYVGKAETEKKLPATQKTYFRGLIVIFRGVFMNKIDSLLGLGHFLKKVSLRIRLMPTKTQLPEDDEWRTIFRISYSFSIKMCFQCVSVMMHAL